MKKVKIGKERDLLFNLWAIKKINKEFGGIENLSDLFDESDMNKTFEKIPQIVTILANAAIVKNNAEVEMGAASGKKEALLTEEQVEACLDIDEMKAFPQIFSELFGEAYQTDIPTPENEEVDEVLEELDAKNE